MAAQRMPNVPDDRLWPIGEIRRTWNVRFAPEAALSRTSQLAPKPTPHKRRSFLPRVS